MDVWADILEQSNQAGIGFLMIELDTALLFLSIADTTRNKENALRNRDNALTAYESVLRYQERVQFDADDRITFDEKFDEVKRALLALGFTV